MKPWYRSRTIWINSLTVAIALVAVLQGSPLFARYSEALLLVNALMNVGLRFVTTQPLGAEDRDAA